MRRVGRDEAIEKRGDLQAPEYAKNQRQMGHRMNLLYGNGHGASPLGAFARQHHSPVRSHSIAGVAFRTKSAWFNLIPRTWAHEHQSMERHDATRHCRG